MGRERIQGPLHGESVSRTPKGVVGGGGAGTEKPERFSSRGIWIRFRKKGRVKVAMVGSIFFQSFKKERKERN